MKSSAFSAEWLALREPVDHRSRSASLVRWLAEALPRDRTVTVLDLAAGTGSNVRYLAPGLPRPQSWLLADHDAALLSAAARTTYVAAAVDTCVVDLAHLYRPDSDEHDGPHLFRGRDVVTAAALLDLVSELWLRNMLAGCRTANAHVLFALTYDGRVECQPHDSDDEAIRTLVNDHQRTDKGFGPALGPEAVGVAVTLLGKLGYEIARERSDWRLSAQDRELQRQLVNGWADAAMEMAAVEAGSISSWRDRRLAHLAAGRSRIVVGHEDVAGRIT